MAESYAYLREGEQIYARSFAIIRAEADLTPFTAEQADVAVRMIHSCGLIELARWVEFSPELVSRARTALREGAPVLCDAEMVARGITRARLPARNEVVCALGDERVAALAREQKTTRSAAALSLWIERMAGAVIAIGNAPTALFRLLELLEEGAPRPAAIVGCPVGFVGAAESKQALRSASLGVPFVTVHGRLGGSAITAGAVNALAIGALG